MLEGLTRDEREMLASALMVYQRSCRKEKGITRDKAHQASLHLEMVELDGIARKLNLVGDYYRPYQRGDNE